MRGSKLAHVMDWRWRRYRYRVGGLVSGCQAAGSDGRGGGGCRASRAALALWEGREGGGCRPRTHQPSPQHTGSEAGEVVSESLEGPVKSDGGRYLSFESRKQGWSVFSLLHLCVLLDLFM